MPNPTEPLMVVSNMLSELFQRTLSPTHNGSPESEEFFHCAHLESGSVLKEFSGPGLGLGLEV